MFKEATSQDLPRTKRIMQRIYDEDPSYWPHGLDAESFDSGLYMVKKSATSEPVGFVGWQSRRENGRNVGYYAIGILPEYRRQGFAKQAVSAIIRKKAGECDEVKAYVMSHNDPSKALAASLDVPVIEKLAKLVNEDITKEAAALKILRGLGSGAATAGLIDLAANKDKGAIGHYVLDNPKADAWTAPDFLLNLGAGAAAAPLWAKHPGMAAGLTSVAAGKTLASPAVRRMGDRNEIFGDIANSLKEQAENSTAETNIKIDRADQIIPKSVLYGAGGLGAGILALLLYKSKRKADHRKAILKEKSKGRVTVTLPTKNPGDSETTLELPMEEVNLSNALRARIGRDTRRRLYAETKERTKRRKPRDPKNPTRAEKEDMDFDKEHDEVMKAASHAPIFGDTFRDMFYDLFPALSKEAIGPAPAPAQNVPTPPVPGQNPVMQRPGQGGQAPQAKSIDTSQQQTAGNPQIEQAKQQTVMVQQGAQQQVQQAQADAANQVAAVQQQSDAALAEQNARMTAEINKATQEKEVLQIQLEKEKAMAELNKTKTESSSGDRESGRATEARINQLRGRIAKTANASIPAPAQPTTQLRPGAVQTMNSSLDATRILSPVKAYRHSYGGVGDWLYDTFLRDYMKTPNNAGGNLYTSPFAMINSPDRAGVLSQMFRVGQQRLRRPAGPNFFNGVQY